MTFVVQESEWECHALKKVLKWSITGRSFFLKKVLGPSVSQACNICQGWNEIQVMHRCCHLPYIPYFRHKGLFKLMIYCYTGSYFQPFTPAEVQTYYFYILKWNSMLAWNKLQNGFIHYHMHYIDLFCFQMGSFHYFTTEAGLGLSKYIHLPSIDNSQTKTNTD